MSEWSMDRNRFDAIIAAYGADARRWPEAERDAALAFAREYGVDVSEARTIDRLLDAARPVRAPSELLYERLQRAAPSRQDLRGAAMALAACMIAGVLVGVGAGLSAPVSASDADDMLITALGAGGWDDAT